MAFVIHRKKYGLMQLTEKSYTAIWKLLQGKKIIKPTNSIFYLIYLLLVIRK